MVSPGRLKVALVVPGYEEGGGVSTVANFLAEALEGAGDFDLRIFSLAVRWNDPLNQRLFAPMSWWACPRWATSSTDGYHFIRIGSRWSEWEYGRYLPRRHLIARLNECDIVQVVCGSAVWANTCRGVKPPVFLQIATTLKRERTGARPRGFFDLRTIPSRLATCLGTRLERRALGAAAGVFTENRWMLEHLRSWIHPRRLHFAPPGVNPHVFIPNPALKPAHILFVGRLNDPRKNLRMLLEAYALMRCRGGGVPPLILAGHADLPAEEKGYIARAGMTDGVEIRRSPNEAELVKLYQTALVLLLPSNEEGLGMVLLEAAACCVPAVATRCGGPETVIENNVTGVLIPVGDGMALARETGLLLADEDRRRMMGLAARRRIEQDFSTKINGRRFIEAYRAARSEMPPAHPKGFACHD